MKGHIHTLVPKDVLEYVLQRAPICTHVYSLVDSGRNPDSHTRSFMNRLASENQFSVGQHESIRVCGPCTRRR